MRDVSCGDSPSSILRAGDIVRNREVFTMPVHDWSRVDAGVFHHFHQRWIGVISDTLNGLLPGEYYALAEQRSAGSVPDVLTLERVEVDDQGNRLTGPDGGGGLSLAEHPLKVRHQVASDLDVYAAKANRVAVYHVSGDRVVAYIELVSPGNKHSERALRDLLDKVSEAMDRGLHLLLVDLHPPTKRDPRGLHARIWEDRYGETVENAGATADEPYTVVAYRAGFDITAYYEQVGLHQPLPDMPIFLTPDRYVNVPLEATYQMAWGGVPRRWRGVIEAPPATT
jgi:hypothetical protein